VSRSPKFKTEAELAAQVVEWLTDQGWDVYQEVQIRGDGSTADIVATQGPLTWVIECKLSMSLDLMAQAIDWKRDAQRISVATPGKKHEPWTKRRAFVSKVLGSYGIGWIRVTPEPQYGPPCVEVLQPELNRRVKERFREHLREEHKTFAKAGNAEGKRWTPFQSTCESLVRYVRRNPGRTLKDIVDGVDHHYASSSSAKQSLSHWIRKGVIKGVELRREGRVLRVYPAPDTQTS
jgi:hypothetical protein